MDYTGLYRDIIDVENAASSVGINLFITNSTEKIETQLNRLTKQVDLPILLANWDIDIDITFDQNGYLTQPVLKFTVLLLNKAEDLQKDTLEKTAFEMADVWFDFLKALRDLATSRMTGEVTDPVQNISTKIVPKHGLGKHSGVLGTFNLYGTRPDPC